MASNVQARFRAVHSASIIDMRGLQKTAGEMIKRLRKRFKVNAEVVLIDVAPARIAGQIQSQIVINWPSSVGIHEHDHFKRLIALLPAGSKWWTYTIDTHYKGVIV